MTIASRTTEGWPSQCPVCGKQVWIEPSQPTGDAVCPHCGGLVWMSDAPSDCGDVLASLAQLGAEAETNDEGEVRRIRLIGEQYDDSVIELLAKLTEVDVLDVRGARLTPDGVQRLQELLPSTRIEG